MPRAIPAGRDARLPAWLGGGRGRADAPRFDAVVVRGNGVGALTFAARLARSPALAGAVRIAAPRPEPDPRLVNGCTLRARTLDYLAAALGTGVEALVASLFGADPSRAETRAQDFALAAPWRDAAMPLRIHTYAEWMRAQHRRPLAYGTRNGHLVARLVEAVAASGLAFEGSLPTSFEACRTLGGAPRTLVVNAAPAPLSDVPAPATPKRFVAASQLTFRRRGSGPLDVGHSCIAMRHRAGAFDTGVFYPFFDPLTPEADSYGIFYRIVQSDAPGFDKERAIGSLRDLVVRFGEVLGLEPVAAERTRGEALVPCAPWRDVTPHRPDYLDLFRTYSACTPIITGDGMTRAALAGWLAAEAVLAGEDPAPATNRSLRRWRDANRTFARGMTSLSRPLGAVLRRAPRFALSRVADLPDTWAGIADAA